MKVVYPIIIQKTSDQTMPYLVTIPALNGLTQGKSIENAMDMAKDYIGLTIMDKQDNNEAIPNSTYDLPKTNKDTIATLINVDLSEYRRKHDTRSIKKTLTIPSYLNELGKERDINFSETLVNALKNKLNV